MSVSPNAFAIAGSNSGEGARPCAPGTGRLETDARAGASERAAAGRGGGDRMGFSAVADRAACISLRENTIHARG